MRRIPLLLAILTVVSCSAGDPGREKDPLACPPEDMDISSWLEWDEGPYSVFLPSEFQLVYRGAGDSEAATWVQPGLMVVAEYGPFANPLTGESALAVSSLVECQGPADYAPRIAAYEGPQPLPYFLGGHWPTAGEPGASGPTRLSVVGSALDPAGRRILRSVIGSVVFHSPPHPRPEVRRFPGRPDSVVH